MYIMNRTKHRKYRKSTTALGVMLVVALGAAVWSAGQYLDPETFISPTPKAKVTRVLGVEESGKEFVAGPVSLRLPKDWEAFTVKQTSQTPSPTYSWRNTEGNVGVRVIHLYLDTIPRQLAVNRLLVVQPEANGLVAVGGVSDNCSEFNSAGRTASTGSSTTPARWQNVAFTCDSANYLRNVVGTGSAQGVNSVRLGGSSGQHELFMTYNDADATPKFEIFTAAVESIRLR